MFDRCSRCTLAVLTLVALPGCADIFPHNWCAPPGPASYQLAVAKKYDPFPDPYIAPEIMGGRPLGFREPRQEPDLTKSAQFWSVSNVGRPATMAPAYVAPPPATTSLPPGSYVAPPLYAPPPQTAPVIVMPPGGVAPGAPPLVPLYP